VTLASPLLLSVSVRPRRLASRLSQGCNATNLTLPKHGVQASGAVIRCPTCGKQSWSPQPHPVVKKNHDASLRRLLLVLEVQAPEEVHREGPTDWSPEDLQEHLVLLRRDEARGDSDATRGLRASTNLRAEDPKAKEWLSGSLLSPQPCRPLLEASKAVIASPMKASRPSDW
jgi:hypothetical protein